MKIAALALKPDREVIAATINAPAIMEGLMQISSQVKQKIQRLAPLKRFPGGLHALKLVFNSSDQTTFVTAFQTRLPGGQILIMPTSSLVLVRTVPVRPAATSREPIAMRRADPVNPATLHPIQPTVRQIANRLVNGRTVAINRLNQNNKSRKTQARNEENPLNEPAQISPKQILSNAEPEAGSVLRFWFVETPPELHFRKDSDFDRQITDRFGKLVQDLAQGKYQIWIGNATSTLAAIITLDQFPRNMYRDTPKAFDHDPIALQIARQFRDRQDYAKLPGDWISFGFMPFMHSENLADQQECVRLGEQVVKQQQFIDYAKSHLEIVERFGRFPHRNQTLGRESTAEEVSFLQQPNSSF